MRPPDGGCEMEPQRSQESGRCPASCAPCSSAPFTIRLLRHEHVHLGTSPPTDNELLSLLPASYRPVPDKIIAASNDVDTCVEIELDMERLTAILPWLWVAGRPMPPRPLHHQILLSREIFAIEKMDMHLVWTGGRIFIKPMPRFLLESYFWSAHMSSTPSCRCAVDQRPDHLCTQACRKAALGFLFSYSAFISHETDFLIAKEKHLLPADVTWPAWRTLVRELDTQHIHPHIDPRFIYGELRLNRLNKIYFLYQTLLRPYMSPWQQYRTFSATTSRCSPRPLCV